MIRPLLLSLVAVSMLGCAAGAATSGRVVLKDDTAVRFTDTDRALIAEYFRTRGLPPGPAKHERGLPSGLAKRDKLPPGLSGAPLPRELEVQLSILPAHYIRRRFGRDVVLMHSGTRVLFDIIHGVGKESGARAA